MRSLFLLLTAPLRLLVSRQFHPAALNCTSVDLPAEIATWSQYGNQTHSRVSGFTQVNNTCSVSPAARRMVSQSLGFLDLPYDFLTSAIAGASISCGEQTSPVAKSGHYGHFDAFASPPLPLQTNLTLRIAADSPGTISEIQIFSVPPEGLTVVSDVDDFLRELQMWNPREFLTNAFGKFRPWENIHQVYRRWRRADPNTHFHYVTDAPETAWRPYVTYLAETFPQGTYDFRPLEFNSWAQTTTSRYESIKRLIETFPNRKYILAGDTATGSVVSAYSRLAKEFPQQVQCVLMRDVQLTEWSNWIIPNLNQLRKTNKYMLFAQPEDIRTEIYNMIKEQRKLGALGNYTCGGVDTGSPSYPGAIAGIISLWQFYMQYATCALQPFRPSPLCAFDQVEGKMVINPINRSWYRFKMAEDPLGRECYEEYKKKLAKMRKQWKDNKRNEIKRDEL